ncbi:polynucleotide adenylyltransferase PcnB [Aquabacterium sp. OR-4]|uniref:polynucleotide adenylyltransferase PcnB n=1 Tax=Aquabacterium sp. OR-4 TaxID=2978127 RepID=UPI0021B23718|nr:polynucleotide adenylyltransferase PcnB [Aquabacterium sp. OR-4]MDT7835789.1 polynucleotide adenylyltransferase PcnB [Aquabacterium sp. OR-4]
MIKKLIQRLLGQGDATAQAAAAVTPGAAAPAGAPARPKIPLGKRVEVPVSEHGIDRQLVDERAIKVVRTLQQAGYQAYIVGGAVRDLLVGRAPKDFDVATDATPEQVKAQFRRAFIIGRRFRIVHVVHGRGRDHEVIEVSTFRAYLDASDATQVGGNEKTSKAELAGQAHAVDASGRVLRDNVWGPQIEDAARRDFTVNAMYYDPETQIVVDYHGGLADVKAKRLRLIGDPATRYREDPVRILRAIRFEAKLGFELDAETAAPIPAIVPQLADVPISRMFDEMIKLLQTGHALASLEVLQKHGLHRGVFPVLEAVFDARRGSDAAERRMAFVRMALSDTDRRVGEGKAVAPSFLLACLLWHDVLDGWTERREAGEHTVPALQGAVDGVFDARIGDVSGRGKLGADMREIWMMQPRLERRQPNTAYTMIEQPRFRAGFDFLRLRADVGEAPAELADWWEDFSLGSDDDREALLSALREAQRPAQRRVPKAAAKPAPVAAPGAAPADADTATAIDTAADAAGDDDASEPDDGPAGEAAEGGSAPARKRRRRRRKPAGGGQGAAPAGGGDAA